MLESIDMEENVSELDSKFQAISLDAADEARPASFSANSNAIPRTVAKSYKIAGVQTDLWIQLFQERIVLACSQLEGRIAHWLLCKPLVPSLVPRTGRKIDYDVSHLLGAAARDDPIYAVYAKRIMERISADNSWSESRPILLGISLRDRNPAVFHTLTDLLVQFYQSATR